MSLRVFHVFFILVSIGLSFGFGRWSMQTAGAEHLYGVIAYALSAALSLYLVWFIRKSK